MLYTVIGIWLLYKLYIARLVFSGDKEKHVLAMYHLTLLLSVPTAFSTLVAFDVDLFLILIICSLIPVVFKFMITDLLSFVNVFSVNYMLYFFNEKWKLKCNDSKAAISF
jgi:hypothetical protein